MAATSWSMPFASVAPAALDIGPIVGERSEDLLLLSGELRPLRSAHWGRAFRRLYWKRQHKHGEQGQESYSVVW